MRRAPGWIVLGQIALEIAALSMLLRLVAKRRGQPSDGRAHDATDVPPFCEQIR